MGTVQLALLNGHPHSQLWAQVSSVGNAPGLSWVLAGSGAVATVGEEEMPAAVAVQGVQGQQRFVACQ
jgi:hypothetical protein